MYNIALHIKSHDWIYILIIGILFGMFMSSLGYILLEYPWLDGTIFGVILGFSITLFSLVFVSYMNKNILPKLKEVYWLPLSILFSFLSGFLGTLVGVYIADTLHLELIPAFHEEIIVIAILIGKSYSIIVFISEQVIKKLESPSISITKSSGFAICTPIA